jgi:hypothetical protein
MKDAFDSSEMHSITMLSKIITKCRFEMIMTNWYWINTECFSAAEKSFLKGSDVFWKIITLCEELFDISQTQYGNLVKHLILMSKQFL